MVDNFQADNNGNIYVEFDYNNIILVDPNRTVSLDGKINERLVDHESLVMFANLEADVLPRTKLLLGISPENSQRQTLSIAKINFLRPGKNNYLGTGYYDELTGKDSLQSQAGNQKLERTFSGGGKRALIESSVAFEENVVDNGLLGITSINVKVSSSFIPTVSVELEDVQGKALFQLGNQSPYASFFNLPYPQFYLTLKGYYGQAIKYQLNLMKFNARFNSQSGNYQITLDFQGFKFNVLNEITINHLLATPHMYSKRFEVSANNVVANPSANQSDLKTEQGAPKPVNNTSPDNNNRTSASFVSEKGYQKIVEVYSEYKSKGLVPPDFPELTLMQLINKFDTFQQRIVDSYPKVQVEPLTNIRNYVKVVQNYFDTIVGTNSSWFAKYTSPQHIVMKDGTKVYFLRKSILGDAVAENETLSRLDRDIKSFNLQLSENPTLGAGKPDEIKLQNLSIEKIILDTLNKADIDWFKTSQSFLNVAAPTSAQQGEVERQLDALYAERTVTKNGKTENVRPELFVFDGEGRFIQTINQIKTEATRKLQSIESAITADLKDRIQSTALGIGFNPTARNISAVIMANTEGFLRLIDDVHTNAWNVKYDSVRKATIQNNSSSAPNTEVRKNVNITNEAANQNQGLVTGQQPVYPWPQFFIESPEDKKGRFQLTYIGDPSVVNLTQGYLFEKWPEVEFVEEYMKGLSQKFSVPLAQSPIESQNTTFLISFNAIEYPQKSNLPYSNKEQLKFLYEIWERQFVTSRYSNFIRGTGNQIQNLLEYNKNVETNNIVKALGDTSPYLIYLIKNTPFTAQDFTNYLRQFSNEGVGRFWQDFIRDFFVTPYIKIETENPFSILQTNDLGLEPQSNVGIENLEQIVKGATNEPFIIDTYPFRNYEWSSKNMANSAQSQQQQVYDTKKSLKVFQDRSVISNFTNIYDYSTNRPVTNFSYKTALIPTFVTQPSETNRDNLFNYFKNKNENPNELIPTEGSVRYLTPSGSLEPLKISSMMNTPYFINAIQEGVTKEKNKEKYPYVSAAYLFLNSLPLSSLRERYKTENIEEDLDFVASCFNKFGAIHKMPYPWILKMGSIWHRYKEFIDNGIDILGNVWKNFDYIGNFDPQTNNVSKVYNLELTQGVSTTISLQTQSSTEIKLQPGFYPKLINDFNRFLNGTDLYSTYSDSEIQKSINNGMLLYQFPNSKIIATEGGVSLNLSTWSVLVPKNIKKSSVSANDCVPKPNDTISKDFYIVPSFGCNLNQAAVECLQQNTTLTTVNLTSNPSMYNGSVRTFWAASNFGYFDNNQITRPTYQEYINIIDPQVSKQQPFKIWAIPEYSKIEEIFGVFDSKSLNIMEQEFLNFCKPSTDISFPIGQNIIEKNNYMMNATYKNFQALIRSLMTVLPIPTTDKSLIFQEAIPKQFENFKNTIQGFMEYDWIVRNGNPSKYSRRIWDSYLSFNSTATIVDPIFFDYYVANSLPTNGGTTTLASSIANFPNEWNTLYKEVGFSTINGLTYTDNGSYITDFFVDNNIKFSVDNIALLSQIIKMYATTKMVSSSTSVSQFKTSLQNYLNGQSTLQGNLLGLVINSIKAKLPNYEQPKEATINSQVQSMQGKVETYEVFKSLNDKWVAGSDYKSKTLFEDILFLDRASRNIGDTIILDIFDIKSMLSKNHLNENMTVYTLLAGLLMKNNFTVMPLPAYVNFYNVQEVDGISVPNPEGSLAFANNLWGTFTNVDYRKTGPKMVCFYVGKPSSHLELPDNVSGYGNDAFELRRSSEVPLLEDQNNKSDWALSNKCVGFNVDIGVRNQNIFSSFSVGQDNGVATSESIQVVTEMINQTNTRTVGNQAANLYNYYKNRSYTCDVVCLGNALIQPTMYFNLRHVPMFNGPYMITQVQHQISAGNFQTTFQGVRQGIYDLPPIDNFLQAINQNLLSQIEALVIQKTDQKTTDGTTSQDKGNDIQTGGNGQSVAADNSCIANLNANYDTNGFQIGTPQQTTITAKDFVDKLIGTNGVLQNNKPLATIIYAITYVRTFSSQGDPNGQFVSNNNNYGLISLNSQYGDREQFFSGKTYYCFNTPTLGNTKSLPMAMFASVDKYLDFMISTVSSNVANIENIGLTKYYVTQFPTQNMTEEDYMKDEKRYSDNFDAKFTEALISADKLGLDSGILVENPPPINQNLNTTPSPTPTCPPTIVSSFSPLQGRPGTIITLNGQNMQYITSISVTSQTNTTPTPVDHRSIQIIGTNKIKFSLPSLPNQPIPGQILFNVNSTNNPSPITVGLPPTPFVYFPS